MQPCDLNNEQNLVIQVIGWWLMTWIVNFQKFVKLSHCDQNSFIRYSDAKYNRHLDILIMDHLKGVC